MSQWYWWIRIILTCDNKQCCVFGTINLTATLHVVADMILDNSVV